MEIRKNGFGNSVSYTQGNPSTNKCGLNSTVQRK